MPVHEIVYRPYAGERRFSTARLFAVPKFSFMAIQGKMLNYVMFGAGCLPLLAFSAYLYVSNNEMLRLAMKIGSFPAISPAMIFYQFFAVQSFIGLFATILSAPKTISPDLNHKALAILFSRPITRMGYIAGKFSVLFGIVGFLTWFQAIALFVAMASCYPGTSAFYVNFWSASLPLLAKAVLAGVVVSTLYATAGMIASSITKNVRLAGGFTMMLILGSSIGATILAEAMRIRPGGAIGIIPLIESTNGRLFDLGLDHALQPAWIVCGIAGWIAAGLLIVTWRIKPVSVHRD